MVFKILARTLLEAAPYIVLGFLVAGLIREFVPRNILKKQLGTKGVGPLFKSVGIGALLPLCSCGVIPLSVGLYRAGAGIGSVLAFSTSSPVLSPIVIALALKLLGAKMTLTLVGSALLGSFLLGALGNAGFNRRKQKTSASSKEFERAEVPTSGNRAWNVFRWSFWELGAGTSIDIIIGLGVASIALAFLPMEWISTWLGQRQLSTLIYVILVGIPVYACSVPSIPIAQSLLLLGATPGAAVAYMIAGPATNLGELNAIRRSMGRGVALFYCAALIIIALAAGLFADNVLFRGYEYQARYLGSGELVVDHCCVPLIFGEAVSTDISFGTVPAWHWPFGVFLAAVLVAGAAKRIRDAWRNPCRVCVWKEYGEQGACWSSCHVKRKHLWLHRLFPRGNRNGRGG